MTAAPVCGCGHPEHAHLLDPPSAAVWCPTCDRHDPTWTPVPAALVPDLAPGGIVVRYYSRAGDLLHWRAFAEPTATEGAGDRDFAEVIRDPRAAAGFAGVLYDGDDGMLMSMGVFSAPPNLGVDMSTRHRVG